MTIKPTNWVLFTIDRKTYFGEFSKLPEKVQVRLENLHSNWHKSYVLLANNVVGLRLHLIVSEEGRKYVEKVHFLFKGLNSSIYSIFNLPGGKYWKNGEMPEIGFKKGLNSDLGFEAKKIVGLQYLERLCDNIVLPEPKTFEASTPKAYWKKHELEIIELLTRLKNKKLEERPMKAKKFLVELTKYDKENKKILSEKEAIILEFKETHPINSKEIIDLLLSIYVDSDDAWDMTQEILHIGDGHYKIGSGIIDYSEERLKMFGNGTLVELNMFNPNHYKFYYKETKTVKGKDKTVTGEEYIRIPKEVSIHNVLKYYQKKFPKKNYTFDNKIIKKDLSERSQKLVDLPHKGETPAKELRKVCYRPVGGTRIFRGVYEDVKHYVDSGKYEFVPKAAWKKQILDDEDNLLVKGEANKSNITLPPDRGKKLGERKEKRKERQAQQQLKSLRKLQKYHRNGHKKPGDAERKLQSEADKVKYVKTYKEEHGVNPRSVPCSRAFEGVILGDNAVVLATINVKAKSSGHAEKILKTIMKNKRGVSCKLTGNIREWKKESGHNRPKNKK